MHKTQRTKLGIGLRIGAFLGIFSYHSECSSDPGSENTDVKPKILERKAQREEGECTLGRENHYSLLQERRCQVRPKALSVRGKKPASLTQAG